MLRLDAALTLVNANTQTALLPLSSPFSCNSSDKDPDIRWVGLQQVDNYISSHAASSISCLEGSRRMSRCRKDIDVPLTNSNSRAYACLGTSPMLRTNPRISRPGFNNPFRWCGNQHIPNTPHLIKLSFCNTPKVGNDTEVDVACVILHE